MISTDLFDLSGKVALVTGSARGLGQAIAVGLAEAGAKLALLDILDNKNGSSKLDLILQLPYQVKGDRKYKEAVQRVQALEQQLFNSRYGIAYVDAAEKLTPLNRPVVNTLPE